MSSLNLTTTTFYSTDSTAKLVESWFIPFDLLMIICLAVTIPLDCLFLSIIIFNKTCHTVPMILVGNTCFTQFLSAVNALYMSVFTLRSDLQQSRYIDSLCSFRGYFGTTTCGLMMYSFLLQAFYRYVTAVHPARLFWQSHRTQTVLIFISWLLCFTSSLPSLLTGYIIYNVDNAICLMPLRLSFILIFTIYWIYVNPVLAITFLYLRLVLYVKTISRRVTPAHILSRTQRELKMVRQTVILVFILLTLGIPYMIFAFISFFATLYKYHFRIAFVFVEMSFPFLTIVLFHFTEPLKAPLKRMLQRRRRIRVAALQ